MWLLLYLTLYTVSVASGGYHNVEKIVKARMDGDNWGEPGFIFQNGSTSSDTQNDDAPISAPHPIPGETPQNKNGDASILEPHPIPGKTPQNRNAWGEPGFIFQNGSSSSDGNNDNKPPSPSNPIPGVQPQNRINREPKLIREFERTNPDQVDDRELFEKDMLLTDRQIEARHSRKAIQNTDYRWDKNPTTGWPLVPYAFGDANVDQDAVNDGIDHWETHTCITFTKTTDFNQPHLRFILSSGCWSYIGKIYFQNGQNISIGNGCNNLGTVVHEIGHAMGLYHEQSRSDRDSYVVLNFNNITPGKEGNYDKEVDSNYSVPYDYSSNMHYGSKYFSKNEEFTIQTKYPLDQDLIGSRDGLSHRDKHLANLMYDCIDLWLAACGKTTDPCQNEGYLGKSCVCVCPPNTSGDFCETVSGTYFDSILPDCSEVVTTEKTITSNDFPNRMTPGDKCTKFIIAPECHFPVVTFTYFDLYKQIEIEDGIFACVYDGLHVRSILSYDGIWYCDDMIVAGDTLTGTSDTLILYLESRTNWEGYSADVTFISDPNCVVAPPTAPVTTPPAPVTTPPAPVTTPPAPVTTPPAPVTTPPAPVTTVPPANPTCSLIISGSTFTWKSPVGTNNNYPNNFECYFDNYDYPPSSPRRVIVTLKKFALQNSFKCERDSVLIKSATSKIYKWCGIKKRSLRVVLPATYYFASFKTDSSIVKKGFEIIIKYITSKCHKVINLKLGDRPRTIYVKKTSHCEFWFKAPIGEQIRLEFKKFKMRKARKGKCRVDYFMVDKTGDMKYPSSTSDTYCSSAPKSVISDSNAMNIVWSIKKKGSVKLKYRLV